MVNTFMFTTQIRKTMTPESKYQVIMWRVLKREKELTSKREKEKILKTLIKRKVRNKKNREYILFLSFRGVERFRIASK